MKKRGLVLLLAVGLILSMLVGCSAVTNGDNSKKESTTQSKMEGSDTKDKTYRFAFLPNTQNNTFQAAMNDTFKKLCDEKGYQYTCLDPDYDLNTQLSQMSDAANQGFDAVFIIPVDSAGVRQGLEQLNEKNIPIINVDTAVVKEDRNLVKSVIGTDCVMAGKLVGEQMVKDYPDGAKIAILDFPSNESCIDRVNGFMEGLGDSKDKFKIVAQQDGKAALDVSMPIAEDIIQANPDLEAFFCINDPSSMGAAAAIKASGKKGIGVYSIDASPDGKEALLDGSFTAVAAQVPIKIAETAFEKAVDCLNGETIDKEIWLPSVMVDKKMAEETAGQWQ